MNAPADPRLSGFVVTCNEARRLADCLASLDFCDEVVVVDLGSNDESVAIARASGARVLHHELVGVVEKVRAKAGSLVANEWIVFLDPDEVFPQELGEELRRRLALDDHVALVELNWQFHFKGEPLRHTIWGGMQRKPVVVHRDRVTILPSVHAGYVVRDGFTTLRLTGPGRPAIRHYWMDGWGQLMAKHRRYIRYEGEARAARGERFSWRMLVGETGRALVWNLIHHRGLRGGPRGVTLSFFYAAYIAQGLLSLRRHERAASRGAEVVDAEETGGLW